MEGGDAIYEDLGDHIYDVAAPVFPTDSKNSYDAARESGYLKKISFGIEPVADAEAIYQNVIDAQQAPDLLERVAVVHPGASYEEMEEGVAVSPLSGEHLQKQSARDVYENLDGPLRPLLAPDLRRQAHPVYENPPHPHARSTRSST